MTVDQSHWMSEVISLGVQNSKWTNSNKNSGPRAPVYPSSNPKQTIVCQLDGSLIRALPLSFLSSSHRRWCDDVFTTGLRGNGSDFTHHSCKSSLLVDRRFAGVDPDDPAAKSPFIAEDILRVMLVGYEHSTARLACFVCTLSNNGRDSFFWFAWISLSNGVRRERMTLVKYLTSTATDARHYLIAPEHTHTLGSNFHNTD